MLYANVAEILNVAVIGKFMISNIIQITINKYWRFTATVLLIVFLVKPLHRIIYFFDRFENTSVEKYKNDPLLKTNRYKKENTYSLSTISEDRDKRMPNGDTPFIALYNSFRCIELKWLQIKSVHPLTAFESFQIKIFILFRNLRI